MENKSRRLFLVGVFVATATVLLVLSIILIGGNQMFFSSRYQLLAKFNDAQGLSEGSVVSLAGIQVGNVSETAVHPDENSVIVRLAIDDSFQDRITKNSVASVRSMGPLGDKYVYIEPGQPSEPLIDGAIIPSVVRKDFIEALEEQSADIAKVGDILSKTSDLMNQLTAENRTALVMENLAAASKNLKDITDRPETHQTLRSLSRILKKVDEGEGTLGRLVNDPSLYERLMDLTGASARNRFLKPLIRSTVESSGQQDADP